MMRRAGKEGCGVRLPVPSFAVGDEPTAGRWLTVLPRKTAWKPWPFPIGGGTFFDFYVLKLDFTGAGDDSFFQVLFDEWRHTTLGGDDL